MGRKFKIITVIGARPQFIKHYAFEKAAKELFNEVSIHTGQHYDSNMSTVFFDELKMKKPSYMLQVGSGSHGMQTGRMMEQMEEIVLKEKPDGIVVYGDTNSTLAGALVASKLHIPIFHIEAGLRSYNKEMPEEINRVLTDHISEQLFVPSSVATSNLKKEGITKDVIEVGDIMKDLVTDAICSDTLQKMHHNKQYYYATIHRPYNTDEKKRLMRVLAAFESMNKEVVFSIHPRTTSFMNKHAIKREDYSNIVFIDPQSYFDNLSYLVHSDGLITDSGGMQKEAYWANIQCVTIRKETEWIETLEGRNNQLIFENLEELATAFNDNREPFDNTLYGSENVAKRIAQSIYSRLEELV